MHRAGLLLVSILACLGATDAGAETIRLSVTSTATADATGARIEIRLHNGGDAAAVNVMPIAAFRGTELPGTLQPLLAPGATAVERLTLPFDPAAPVQGTWPVFIRVTYSDAGQHPFEALHVGRVAFDPEPPDAPIAIRMSDARLTTTGTAVAEISGPSGARVMVTFAAPLGLAVVPENAVLTLDGTTRTLAAVMTNAGATDGSRLPVFAVAEFEQDGRHATAIAASIVSVEAARASRPVWPLVSALLLMALVLGAFFTMSRYRRRGDMPRRSEPEPR